MTSSQGVLLPPSDKTLAKYGLSKLAWYRIAAGQGGVCAICGGLPKSGRLHIDHEHVKGWKRMAPRERAKYVRGLCCFRCNSQFLRRGLTLTLAKKVVDYLFAYTSISNWEEQT